MSACRVTSSLHQIDFIGCGVCVQVLSLHSVVFRAGHCL